MDPALRGILTTVTDAATLAAEVSRADGPVNVFATYHSLRKIAEAHRLFHMPPWDVLVCDEAHRTVGNLNKPWAMLLDAQQIFAHHRLFVTATPRNFEPEPGQDLPVDIEVASMDDLNLYGPVVFRLSLADAIDRGLLADYRIVAVDVDDADLRAVLNRNPMLAADSEGLRVAAAQVALLRAMHQHDLRRALVFCPLIKAAGIFAETLTETAALMPKRMQGPLQVGTVNSNQSRYERLTQVSAFKEASLTSSDKKPLRAVLTNCAIFAEGVDVPSIDAVLFTSPKTSTYQIVQAVGRALRPLPGEAKVAHIIVPVYKAPAKTSQTPPKAPASISCTKSCSPSRSSTNTSSTVSSNYAAPSATPCTRSPAPNAPTNSCPCSACTPKTPTTASGSSASKAHGATANNTAT
ncbi:helicase-related protein [Streptomyces canus]|uniref:helicase-related protein n=1 Tax=Streptomyces canus TaxID=58343 RepID=UPI0033C0AC82